MGKALLLEMTLQVLLLASPLLLTALAHGVVLRYDLFVPLKKPLDMGLSFRHRPLFGQNKTLRGLVVHVPFSCLGTWILSCFQGSGWLPSWVFLLDYESRWHVAGLLMGLGMTIGELPNSFLKRQLGIPPGEKGKGFLGRVFFLLDQVDLIIGIWVFLYPLIKPSAALILWSFPLTFFMHMCVSALGYVLGMRKTMV